jgi:hypothetical protein
LVALLGKGWVVVVVTENMGWHYRAKFKANGIEVHKHGEHCYWANAQHLDAGHATATTPRQAVRELRLQVVRIVRNGQRVLDQLEDFS